MKRRAFVTIVAGAGLVWPFAAKAERTATPVIGFLSARSPAESGRLVAAFREGLREGGFVEGENVAIAYRWAEGRYDRLPALAAELVALRVSLLFAAGGPVAVFAAKGATSTIPIVFSGSDDPVRLGLVASLNRPGGNVTGMSLFTMALVAKSLGLLRELLPAANVIAYMVNPSNPSAKAQAGEARAAARALGVRLHLAGASTDAELDPAFAALAKSGARGVVIPADAFFDSHRDVVVAAANRYAVATICPWREYVADGGLLSYGSSLVGSYRGAAVYATRILKGEKPAELPIQQPTRLEMVINLKTARALGIAIPQSLLLRADEVIQ